MLAKDLIAEITSRLRIDFWTFCSKAGLNAEEVSALQFDKTDLDYNIRLKVVKLAYRSGLCPDCANEMRREGGCSICVSCGYSLCK